MLNRIKDILKIKNIDLLLISLTSLIFSFWLMFSTFSYQNGKMEIATKAWSDFSGDIPLIRSFSFGNNFPPQYPLFSGPLMRFHFLFYAFVGFLEKIGIQINYALNIPSALGFCFLMIMIYVFAKKLFSSKTIGVLSVAFFLFNGSLSFLNFFKQHTLSNNFVFEIINNKNFPSFGPYDQSIVSAFWNLNIYTNQRHLGLSFALSLFIIYIVYFNLPKLQNKTGAAIILGLILGVSYLLNIAVFLMTVSVLACFILLNIERKNVFILLCIAFIIFFPQYLYFQGENSGFKLLFAPGYLINNNLSLVNLLKYWFMNLGFHSIFLVLGFLISPKKIKLIFISFLSLFLIGNLFQFSPEMAANHKFFNLFMIVCTMFSAFALCSIWKKGGFFKLITIVFVFFLIFSGIIDFFPIFNDTKIVLADYKANPDILWLMKNTKPNSVFFNTQYLYDNASLAGREIFLGWPYFAWSSGYNTDQRQRIRNYLLTTSDKKFACKLLKENNIDYVEISPISPNADNPQISNMYVLTFNSVYKNPISSYNLLSVKKSCR